MGVIENNYPMLYSYYIQIKKEAEFMIYSSSKNVWLIFIRTVSVGKAIFRP